MNKYNSRISGIEKHRKYSLNNLKYQLRSSHIKNKTLKTIPYPLPNQSSVSSSNKYSSILNKSAKIIQNF